MNTGGARLEELPGHELVAAGIEDLRRGLRTPEALLVQIGRDRLRAGGLDVPRVAFGMAFPEHQLYDLLAAQDSEAAHSRYNSLIRRLVSFERALARAPKS